MFLLEPRPFAEQREDSKPREGVGFGALQLLFPDLGWKFLCHHRKTEGWICDSQWWGGRVRELQQSSWVVPDSMLLLGAAACVVLGEGEVRREHHDSKQNVSR